MKLNTYICSKCEKEIESYSVKETCGACLHKAKFEGKEAITIEHAPRLNTNGCSGGSTPWTH